MLLGGAELEGACTKFHCLRPRCLETSLIYNDNTMLRLVRPSTSQLLATATNLSSTPIFDDPCVSYHTDSGHAVSAVHRRICGVDDMEITIRQVKGTILAAYSYIYCASGIIHVIDTVLDLNTTQKEQQK